MDPDDDCKNLSWVGGVDEKSIPRVTVWPHKAYITSVANFITAFVESQ